MKKIQAGYKVQTLSQFLGKLAPAAPAAIDFIKPLTAEQERTSLQFFDVLNFILHLSGNRGAMAKLSMKDLEKILVATLTGMTVDEFKAEVAKWIATAKHPAGAVYDEAKKDGWIIISMKNDWKRIFAFE